jgi:hypothetical protein
MNRTSYRKKKLSRRKDGQFVRSVGKVLGPAGELKPKRFLLGSDEARASLANTLLEQAWSCAVVRFEAHREWCLQHCSQLMRLAKPGGGHYTKDEVREFEPRWLPDGLVVADAARQGHTVIHVCPKEHETEQQFLERLLQLRSWYEPFHFVPAGEYGRELYETARTDLEGKAAIVRRSAEMSANANAPASETSPMTGVRLYEAIDAFAAHLLSESGRESAKKNAEASRRLKASISDMDLGMLNYTALENIRKYWANRPPARKRGGATTGKPISIDTVEKQLQIVRRLVRWIDRHDEYDWSMPRHADEALRVDLRRLKTPEETSSMRHGVPTFTVEQLAEIYAAATDRVRFWMLLGLNAGFAQAECTTLRWDEIEGDPPRIKRIRLKSGVYGEIALWPETQSALAWWERVRGRQNERVVVTERGEPYDRQRIANAWRTLGDRLDPAGQWWLSFKYLRKTAYQFVLNASNGEVAGIFNFRGHAVESDPLADKYGTRPFERVDAALNIVRGELQPMFDAAPTAFTSNRIGQRA